MRDLRAQLYDSPEWELRGKDSLGLLGECRFNSNPRYQRACNDERFWETSTITRYIDRWEDIPPSMSWREWYAYLTLGDRVLVGLRLPSSPVPALGVFNADAKFPAVVRWFMDNYGIGTADIRVSFPSGTQHTITYDRGMLIGYDKNNRTLREMSGSIQPWMARVLIEVL